MRYKEIADTGIYNPVQEPKDKWLVRIMFTVLVGVITYGVSVVTIWMNSN